MIPDFRVARCPACGVVWPSRSRADLRLVAHSRAARVNEPATHRTTFMQIPAVQCEGSDRKLNEREYGELGEARFTHNTRLQDAVEGRCERFWSSPREPSDVFIFAARYCGLYEGAPWIAAHGNISEPFFASAQADDMSAGDWWEQNRKLPLGRGGSPQEALDDLHRVWRIGRAAYEAERNVEDDEDGRDQS